MEGSTESNIRTNENEHKGDGTPPPFPPGRKKPRYRSGADFVGPADKKRPVCNVMCLVLRDMC